MNVIYFFATPFIEIYESIFDETTVLEKLIRSTVFVWLIILFGLFILGWTSLVFELITNPSSFRNATFGVFDTLG